MRKPNGLKSPGRPTKYKRKNKNRLFSVAFTDEARTHFDQQVDASGLSRADYIEALVRGDIPPVRMA